MDLSIIIVNYNGEKYLDDCLSSIFIQCEGINFEIIIWDNASSDDSNKLIKANYGNRVTLIESKMNLGFAGGNNGASKLAKGTFLLLLNNDTILIEPIKPALDLMKSDAKIGALGIKMLNGYKRYTNSCGSLPKPYQLIYFKLFSSIGGPFLNGEFQAERPIEVGWLSGSFLMTPKALWDDIDGLDESYFMYVEDVDYSKKVKDRGYKRIFMPNIEYIHLIGFQSAKNNLLVKGYRIYINKHFKGLKKLIGHACLSINEQVKKFKGNYGD
ncbi:glycosyltransferase family 2 protein [Mangrovimonas sp. AS39]|uniref:glycosyltransferase family 2 protein n=1 Tax=Mangrovimonas futianensis TaxID=2895523 RepID=UPI001E4547E8|nr:glycosyltransferase family 2 protein [Mangrovimonas futianensis]MCF1190315.1 glycosyltransferase family 2 protein [Mangrovimonas futianensis]MCF1193932.1 glycosyltransferase family 2 protein [Mangrovimonas futianensis]